MFIYLHTCVCYRVITTPPEMSTYAHVIILKKTDLRHRLRGFCKCTCSAALPASLGPELGRLLPPCRCTCTPRTSGATCVRHGRLCSAPTRSRPAGVRRRPARLSRKTMIFCRHSLSSNRRPPVF